MILLDGTLMVTLIDTQTDNAIWNGHASGVTVPEGVRGEYVLVRSVRSISTVTAFSPRTISTAATARRARLRACQRRATRPRQPKNPR